MTRRIFHIQEWRHFLFVNPESQMVALQMMDVNEDVGFIFIIALDLQSRKLACLYDVLDVGKKFMKSSDD